MPDLISAKNSVRLCSWCDKPAEFTMIDWDFDCGLIQWIDYGCEDHMKRYGKMYDKIRVISPIKVCD